MYRVKAQKKLPAQSIGIVQAAPANDAEANGHDSSELAVLYAQKIAVYTQHLMAFLWGSDQALLMLSDQIEQQIQSGNKLTDLLDFSQQAESDYPVQDAGFVQDTPKDLKIKIRAGLKELTQETACSAKAQKVRKLMVGLKFQAHFVHAVVMHCLADPSTPLKRTQRQQLRSDADQLMAARIAMINENIGLVFFIARQYTNSAVSFDDLVQEGTLGLIKAVDRFDWQRSVKFSTYAVYWIRQGISRGIIRQEKMIRLPFTLAVKESLVYGQMKVYFQQHDKWPRADQLADVCQMPQDEIETIIFYLQPALSLNAPMVGNDPDNTAELGANLEQHQYQSVQDDIQEIHLRNAVNKAFKQLTEREIDVLNNRFGLNQHSEMTLQEIGEKYHLSRERMRQIQNDALRKLKNSFSGDLSDFIESG